MKKSFTLWQLFSVVDGRLSTRIEDVYQILDHVCDDSLMTHHLPVAMRYLAEKNPEWFQDAKSRIDPILLSIGSNQWEVIAKSFPFRVDNIDVLVPQLKDEFDVSDYGDFMVNNSLLLKRFS